VPISHFPYTGFEQTSQNGGRNDNERAGRFIQKIYEDCECKKIELGEWASHPNSILDGVNKKDDVGVWEIRGPSSLLATIENLSVPNQLAIVVWPGSLDRLALVDCESDCFRKSTTKIRVGI
jgi:hypothetical protein